MSFYDYDDNTILEENYQKEVNEKLFESCKNGNLEGVISALGEGANINEKFSFLKRTALMQAARNGHFNIVQYLVDRGADLDVLNDDGNNVLYEAIRSKNNEIINYLIDKNVKVENIDYDNNSILTHIILFDLPNKIELFSKIFDKIEKNGYLFNINSIDKRGYSILSNSSRQNVDIIEFLISKGADVNLRNQFGNTPLMQFFINPMFFRYHNCQQIIDLFTRYGADINAVNNEGQNALFLCLLPQDKSIRLGNIELLLSNKINVDIHDKNGNTFLMELCKFPVILEMLDDSQEFSQVENEYKILQLIIIINKTSNEKLDDRYLDLCTGNKKNLAKFLILQNQLEKDIFLLEQDFKPKFDFFKSNLASFTEKEKEEESKKIKKLMVEIQDKYKMRDKILQDINIFMDLRFEDYNEMKQTNKYADTAWYGGKQRKTKNKKQKTKNEKRKTKNKKRKTKTKN